MKGHLFVFAISVLFLCGFSMDVAYYSSSGSIPVLMERSDFEQGIKTLPAKTLERTTRISLKGSYIFIVEQFMGVHVIQNADPSKPELLHFISIPGCTDMTIKDDIMYARSAEDLVAINISDLSHVQEINRVRETFPELYFSGENYVPYKYSKEERPENTVIVGWIQSNSN